jgi:phosphatidylglycerol lysyltransferase
MKQERILALITVLIAVMNIWSALTPALPWRLAILHDYLPLELTASTRLATVFSGFALLLLSRGLWRRKKTAWVITEITLLLSLFFHVIKGLDFEEATAITLFLVWLSIMYKRFSAESDRPSLVQGLRTVFFSILFTMVYGVTGFFFLDKHFSISFSLWAAVKQTVLMFVALTPPPLVPITRFGKYFVDSIYTVSIGTLGYGLLMMLRPVLIWSIVDSAEQAKAKKIIELYGHSALAHYALLPDKKYFFYDAVVIAYVTQGNTVLVLGDPIGPEHMLGQAIQSFVAWCERNDWNCSFYQVGGEYLVLYKQQGFKKICIGHEGIIDVAKFSLEGKENRSLRNSYNRLQKQGYRARLLHPPQTDYDLEKLHQISESWLTQTYGKEKRFSFGWFRDDYIGQSLIMAIEDVHGNLCAFANIIPEYRLNETTVDLMRYDDQAPAGTMDFLFLALFQWAHQAGYATFNIGLSALFNVQQEKSDNPVMQKILQFIYENSSKKYNFKGLHFFKEKFKPSWAPRYLLYRSQTELPGIFLALLKAFEAE